jgi:hypothetical protein
VQHYIQNECTKNQKQKMAYLFSGDSGDSDSAVVPLVCLRPFPLLPFASVPVCFILSAAPEMMMKVPAFCYWFGCFFCAGMSAEMKAMAMTILYVCCISFLSFSLCIISLLWVFCSVFSTFFLYFFGLIFRSLLCFWVPFSASGVLTFSALVPPMIFDFFFHIDWDQYL